VHLIHRRNNPDLMPDCLGVGMCSLSLTWPAQGLRVPFCLGHMTCSSLAVLGAVLTQTYQWSCCSVLVSCSTAWTTVPIAFWYSCVRFGSDMTPHIFAMTLSRCMHASLLKPTQQQTVLCAIFAPNMLVRSSLTGQGAASIRASHNRASSLVHYRSVALCLCI
jgi:hypothetical protein